MNYQSNNAGGFRRTDEGSLLGHEHGIGGGFGMQDPMAASNRFERIEGNDWQAGDIYNTRGMAPPTMPEGATGSWRFAGAGTDTSTGYGDDAINEFQTSQWVFEPAQQAAPAPVPVPEAPAPRRDVTPPPEYRPNRMYEDNDYWLDMARRSTEGMNRMPFVGPTSNRYGINTGQSGYADLPYDPLLVMEEFYPTRLQGWQEGLTDPLDGELLDQPLINAQGSGQGRAQGTSQRRLSPSEDRIPGYGLVSLLGQ
jgi:hypothetical protein